MINTNRAFGNPRKNEMDKNRDKNIVEILNEIPLFENLAREYVKALSSIVVEKDVPKNYPVFFEGDEANGFYVVMSGKVKIFKLSFEGKEQIIHIFGPGEPFGEVPVFEGSLFPAHAQSLEKSRLLFFPRTEFVALIEANSALALSMLAVLCRRLRSMTSMIEELSLKEVPGRIATYLLLLRERSGNSNQLVLDITKSQLASLIGTTPETVSRILTKLVQEGFVELDGARITISDHAALEMIASEGKLA